LGGKWCPIFREEEFGRRKKTFLRNVGIYLPN
jgi:hypothetical protein